MKDAVAVLAGYELRRQESAVWRDLAWRSLTAALLGRLQAVRSLGPEIEWAVLCEGLPVRLGAAFEHARRPGAARDGKGRSGRIVLLASWASWDLPEDLFIEAVAEDWLRLPAACTSLLTAQIAAWLCRVPQLPRNLGGDDHGAAGDV